MFTRFVRWRVAAFVACGLVLLLGRATADEIRLATGEWIKNCKVIKLADGRYEVRLSAVMNTKMDAKLLDLNSLVLSKTDWEGAEPAPPAVPEKPPEKAKPVPPPKPAPPKPPEKEDKVKTFTAALQKQLSAKAQLKDKRLVVEGDTVYEMEVCAHCGGNGKLRMTSSRPVQCPSCRGTGEVLTMSGAVGTCNRCGGTGRVRVALNKVGVCPYCDGQGYRRGGEKGLAADLAALVPEIKPFEDATRQAVKTAWEMLAEPELKSVPAEAFASAVDLLRTRPDQRRVQILISIEPKDQGFVCGEATITGSMPVPKGTAVVFRIPPADFRHGKDFRALIVLPPKTGVSVGRQFVIRGKITGKQGELYVVEDYQTYPDILQGE